MVNLVRDLGNFLDALMLYPLQAVQVLVKLLLDTNPLIVHPQWLVSKQRDLLLLFGLSLCKLSELHDHLVQIASYRRWRLR